MVEVIIILPHILFHTNFIFILFITLRLVIHTLSKSLPTQRRLFSCYFRYCFFQYENLPTVFRDGANAAFHEAVGDTIALSVSVPEHLAAVGLIEPLSETKDSKENRESKLEKR